tara:strand:- start:533 stop:808 length:276 start_codon:yes stop_codon:yes gene_type:complete
MKYTVKLINNYFLESNQHPYWQCRCIFKSKERICYFSKQCKYVDCLHSILNRLGDHLGDNITIEIFFEKYSEEIFGEEKMLIIKHITGFSV